MNEVHDESEALANAYVEGLPTSASGDVIDVRCTFCATYSRTLRSCGSTARSARFTTAAPSSLSSARGSASNGTPDPR